MSFRKRLEDALNRFGRFFGRWRPTSAYDRLMEAIVDVGMDIESYAEIRAGILAVADLTRTEFEVYCGINGWAYEQLRERALAGFDLHDAFDGVHTTELRRVYAVAFGRVPPQLLTGERTPKELRAHVLDAARRIDVPIVR